MADASPKKTVTGILGTVAAGLGALVLPPALSTANYLHEKDLQQTASDTQAPQNAMTEEGLQPSESNPSIDFLKNPVTADKKLSDNLAEERTATKESAIAAGAWLSRRRQQQAQADKSDGQPPSR